MANNLEIEEQNQLKNDEESDKTSWANRRFDKAEEMKNLKSTVDNSRSQEMLDLTSNLFEIKSRNTVNHDNQIDQFIKQSIKHREDIAEYEMELNEATARIEAKMRASQ